MSGQSGDRELAKDVRTFLDKHQGMNATPEVFAAHHGRIIGAEQRGLYRPRMIDRPKIADGAGREYWIHRFIPTVGVLGGAKGNVLELADAVEKVGPRIFLSARWIF